MSGLTDEQKKAIEAHFKAWPIPPCQVCGQPKTWAIENAVLEAREFKGGGFTIGGGKIYPFIAVTCQNCFHSVIFSAVKIGIVQFATKAADNA